MNYYYNIIQLIEKTHAIGQFEHDQKKSFKFACFGGFNIATFVHLYMTIFIEWVFPGRAAITVAKKLLFDQLIVAPLMVHWMLFS